MKSLYSGNIKFKFYDGNGDINYQFTNGTEKGNFKITGLNLEKLIQKLNREIYISGIFDIKGNFIRNDNGYEMTGEIKSVNKRGVKKIMNFGAVKFFTTLAGGNPIKTIGTSNFYYGKIGMKITLKNNRLTIEGLLGERNGQQYIIRGRFLRNSINLTIDKSSNTIRISDLKERIQKAIERSKKGVKIGF